MKYLCFEGQVICRSYPILKPRDKDQVLDLSSYMLSFISLCYYKEWKWNEINNRWKWRERKWRMRDKECPLKVLFDLMVNISLKHIILSL